jgi:hypothetical protein
MYQLDLLEDEIVSAVPPLPPIHDKAFNEDGGGERTLTAILKYHGKNYHVECRSRKYSPRFHFHHSELGEVIYGEDETTMLYSQKELDAEIYAWMRRTIKAWVKNFSSF